MKKKYIEMVMGILLLAGIWILSQKTAVAVSQNGGNKVIVVDAGHGGFDCGMVGIGGLEEKGINLSIAEKLKSVLEKEGFTVVMTREDDGGLYQAESTNKKVQDMQKRCEIIAKAKPLLTISVHQNSYTDSSVYGPQVFYYHNSVGGEALAKALQEALNRELAIRKPRAAKGNGSYYLLKRSEGVLNIVECGFLTNPRDAELLQQEAYQEKVAKALAHGVLAYLEAETPVI